VPKTAGGAKRSAGGGIRNSDSVNTAYDRRLGGELEALRAAGTFKTLRHLTTPMAAAVHMEEAGDVIVLSSNNYLGLADNPRVIEAGIRGLRTYGAGTASVRFICGTFDIHRALEEKIASFLGMPAALTYVSCWTANEGLIPTLAVAGTAILSDELNHASIIDGCRLAQAQRLRYKHSDMADLEAKLASLPPDMTKFIITDGVFSMEGDLAKLPEIVALAERYNGVVIVDDSHGTGVMGRTGRGTVEHYGLTGRVDIITGTLGKALGGAAGGFVAASANVIQTLVQKSRTQLFSNALPPTVACSALAAIEELERHPELLAKQRANTAYFRTRLVEIGYRPLEGESAIIPIIVGDTAFAIRMSELLLAEGVFVTGFGYPVVPEGTARIRVQMSAALERPHLDKALAAFEKVGTALGIIPSKV
jgi:glycine C-acetyltransferase